MSPLSVRGDRAPQGASFESMDMSVPTKFRSALALI